MSNEDLRVDLSSLKAQLELLRDANRPDHKGRTCGLEELESFLVSVIRELDGHHAVVIKHLRNH